MLARGVSASGFECMQFFLVQLVRLDGLFIAMRTASLETPCSGKSVSLETSTAVQTPLTTVFLGLSCLHQCYICASTLLNCALVLGYEYYKHAQTLFFFDHIFTITVSSLYYYCNIPGDSLPKVRQLSVCNREKLQECYF